MIRDRNMPCCVAGPILIRAGAEKQGSSAPKNSRWRNRALPPARGHSCPQQLPNAQPFWRVRGRPPARPCCGQECPRAVLVAVRSCGHPKIEFRIPKNSEIRRPNSLSLGLLPLVFGFRVSGFFRISIFGLRISIRTTVCAGLWSGPAAGGFPGFLHCANCDMFLTSV